MWNSSLETAVVYPEPISFDVVSHRDINFSSHSVGHSAWFLFNIAFEQHTSTQPQQLFSLFVYIWWKKRRTKTGFKECWTLCSELKWERNTIQTKLYCEMMINLDKVVQEILSTSKIFYDAKTWKVENMFVQRSFIYKWNCSWFSVVERNKIKF